MGIWCWLNANSAGVTAIATAIYAVMTLGLCFVTWFTARRTQELARVSRDTLKLQVLAHYVDAIDDIVSRASSDALPPRIATLALKHYADLLRGAFPEQMAEIQKMHEEVLSTYEGTAQCEPGGRGMKNSKNCEISEWATTSEARPLGACSGNVLAVRVAYQGADTSKQKIMATFGKRMGSGGLYLCEGHREKLERQGFTIGDR